ncbi:LPXTG cell wall anchor domain-containing protein [Paenibacillus puerhi]|uniref:LPXTG cell wall anchor domain-containing protein n=1 Tax=Paenibacillus puerhi TaxID=2692622 RepID=UPI0013573558|nr:LPXTG cell wall anchor domain-containing protein [Paenibacillus puerhi]
MRALIKRKFSLWLSLLLVLGLVFPVLGVADRKVWASDDQTLPAVTIQAGGSATVGGDVYGGTCKPIIATTQKVWQSILSPVMTAGKVTFTIPEEYCSIELSFTSYAFKDNVKPDHMGAPYNKQYVHDNKTAVYGPGTHTVEIDMPCGYWQIDLYSGPVIPSVPYGHPAALLIKALVNHQVNGCEPEPTTPTLDLIDVTAMCVNTTGQLRFELTNRNSTSATIGYTLADQNGQVTLGANETKVIEIVSNSTAVLQLSLNGVSKDTVAANPQSCNPGPATSVQLIDAAALCFNESGIVRFQLTNRNAAAAEVAYSLEGVSGKITLAAGESRIVELASASKELLKVTVNGVSKDTVAASTEDCNPGPVSTVELVDAAALCFNESGIARFQLTNRNATAAEVVYSLGNATGEVTLAAGQSEIVELASTSTDLLNVTVNGVSKDTVAASTGNCNPGPISTVELVDAAALCVNETGIVRFQLTNRNSTVTEVTYSLNGLNGQVTLPANGGAVIQLATAADGELLKVGVGGESKDTVQASATLCSNPGGGDGGGDNGGGSDDGDTTEVDDDPVPTGPPVTPTPSTPTPGGQTPGTPVPAVPGPAVPDTDIILPEDSDVPRGTGQPTAEQPAGEQTEEIADGEIPLGYSKLPQTGEKTPWTFYGLGALLIAAGLVTGLRKRRAGL